MNGDHETTRNNAFSNVSKKYLNSQGIIFFSFSANFFLQRNKKSLLLIKFEMNNYFFSLLQFSFFFIFFPIYFSCFQNGHEANPKNLLTLIKKLED